MAAYDWTIGGHAHKLCRGYRPDFRHTCRCMCLLARPCVHDRDMLVRMGCGAGVKEPCRSYPVSEISRSGAKGWRG